jgi:hypothetical protein
MRKFVLLVVVALVALPGLALASGSYGGGYDCGDNNNQVTTTSGAFQSYGEMTASYSAGASEVKADIFQIDTKKTTIDCAANVDTGCATMDYRTACNQAAAQCGLNINVKECNVSITDGTLHQVSAIGSNSMSMLGTASFCGEPKAICASFTESQQFNGNVSFAGSGTSFPGVTSGGTYVGFQTFTASAPK